MVSRKGKSTKNKFPIPSNRLTINWVSTQLAPFKFREEVGSWFFEIGIPLVTSSMNIPFVRSLDLDYAWRREEFRDTNLLRVPASPVQTTASYLNGNSDENFGGSPSVSLRYQPDPDLMVRASWRQSIRPPTFDELFRPVFQNFPILFGAGPGPVIQPPSGIWIGGNPEVKPETTDSYSAGVVWSPKFVPGFMITVDAYQMFTTNVIVDPETFAQVLIARNVPDPDGCGLGVNLGSGPSVGVTRADPNSPIDCVDSGFGNAGKRLVQGVEITATYVLPTEHWGLFTFSGGWNHVFTWKARPGVGPFNSFLGNYNNGTLPLAPGAIPWNKGFLRGQWEWRGFDFIATGNYIGDFRDDPSFDDFPPPRPERRNVPSYITLDMQLSYEFVRPEAALPYSKDAKAGKNMMQPVADTSSIWQRLLWGTTLTAGVNNAFDRTPPTVLGAPNDNYDTSLHTIRNRFYYVALSKKF